MISDIMVADADKAADVRHRDERSTSAAFRELLT